MLMGREGWWGGCGVVMGRVYKRRREKGFWKELGGGGKEV